MSKTQPKGSAATPVHVPYIPPPPKPPTTQQASDILFESMSDLRTDIHLMLYDYTKRTGLQARIKVKPVTRLQFDEATQQQVIRTHYHIKIRALRQPTRSAR